MTGIADFYLYLKNPYSEDRRKRLLDHFFKVETHTRFAVLSWKRTGSNLLCGMLHLHPEIIMHNELFNPIDIFTYHPSFKATKKSCSLWTVLTRDLSPGDFLSFVWTGMRADQVTPIKPKFKAVGFKSFPEHWIDVRNEPFWHDSVVEDLYVKKIILKRDDELAVFVSMKRVDQTGLYMTHSYPQDMKLHIDPAEFQRFINNYRNTFQNKYRSPYQKRDSFHITYEQLTDEENFETNIAPKLWEFLGVNATTPIRRLKETIKQAKVDEDLSKVISNYDELEFCFRHSDILHFQRPAEMNKVLLRKKENQKTDLSNNEIDNYISSWSLLVPICSRPKVSWASPAHDDSSSKNTFNSNRFIDLVLSSQYNPDDPIDSSLCWKMLEDFGESLRQTASEEQLKITECIFGIDMDDSVFNGDQARERILTIIPCKAIFVEIGRKMYGQVCKIWNLLGKRSSNDYVVLLGDDIKLLDVGWQERVVKMFHHISRSNCLPLGAACITLKDLAFPGFPTFPVLHRWHIQHFGAILPKQFANQGGDPFLFELYSRYNASAFEVSCRLENAIGGDGDARYTKHQISWRGQILSMNLRMLEKHLNGRQPGGFCIDVVVPCYRSNNEKILRSVLSLRASVQVYVKFWIIVDNPLADHVERSIQLASEFNMKNLEQDCNYFVNVIHYGENRGASYARNIGFNYTTADWVLFLDDDIIPDSNILDAYIGALKRYPEAKVFVGFTELPEAFNLWTEMMKTCNVGYFYGIAKLMVHPSWGVTANLLVRGSRHNTTIQFKSIYPKTGGGEDIDFVYQFKEWYRFYGRQVTVAVPEAKVHHPWWNSGNTCYKQIMGWAWGDSICLYEWKEKTFFAFPNWIELILFFIFPLVVFTRQYFTGLLVMTRIIVSEHVIKGLNYYTEARKHSSGGLLRTVLVSAGAGTVLSSQEITRAIAIINRRSICSICRRVDWFDGEKPRTILDIQLWSALHFGLYLGLTWMAFQ